LGDTALEIDAQKNTINMTNSSSRIILPPLRIPLESALAADLEVWLRYLHEQPDLNDQHNNSNGSIDAAGADAHCLPLAEECMADLARLAEQRMKVREVLLQGYAVAVEQQETLWVYARLLRAFGEQGFRAALRKESKKQARRRSNPNVVLADGSDLEPSAPDTPPPMIALAWTTDADGAEPESCPLWEWEEANIWWTMANLEVFQAQQLAKMARVAPMWKKVMGHYAAAATWVSYLQQEYFCASDLSNQQPTRYLWSVGRTLTWEGLCLWQSLLVATAQRAAVQVTNQAVLKAKLSAAAVQCYTDCQSLLEEEGGGGGERHAWETHVQAWLLYTQATAQAYQAQVHASKQESTAAYHRYSSALEYADRFSQSDIVSKNEEVSKLLLPFVARWQDTCSQLLENTPSVATAAKGELPVIPPQRMVKLDLKSVTKELAKADTSFLNPPLFKNLLSPDLRLQMQSFQAQIETLLLTTVRRAEEKAEKGRRALAIHNLPATLQAYQVSESNGLPVEVWDKIAALQEQNQIDLLQQELWELKDMADMTQQTYKQIMDQLDEDLAMDGSFRQEHPRYKSHDVKVVQTKYRQALQNYETLMETAKTSDSHLLNRLEELPTDPKIKLLSFRKSQLDCLLPSSVGGGARKSDVDVQPLNQALENLSDLFRERDELVQELTTAVQKFNLMDFVQEVVLDPAEQSASALQGIFQSVQESLEDMVQDIQQNMQRQTDLVKHALDENVKFVRAREEMEDTQRRRAATNGGAIHASNRTMVMIHQALEEVDELSKYLEEGKAFYNVVLPKLKRLRQNVEDLSTRLTIARFEYEDQERQTRQEIEDAEMAASMADTGGGGGTTANDLSGVASAAPAGRPKGDDTTDLNLSSGSLLDAPEVGVGIPASDDDEEDSKMHSSMGPRPARRPEADDGDSDRIVSRPHSGGGPRHGVASAVSHQEPARVHVDDAKVAHLIGMDFDPEQVVEALTMYDNNLEQALNFLLSGGEG
jgi:programmed cell death 6-interacting protein